MKRILCIFMILVMTLGLFSCAINDTEIDVIWSDLEDDYLATIADAVDRGMYIKNIKYRHVDSEGDAAKQLSQVDAALEKNNIVVVSATDPVTAIAIVEKARAKEATVIFLCCDVAKATVDSYEKCYYVDVDARSVFEVLGERIAADLVADYDKYDRNKDGKISYLAFGDASLLALNVSKINEKLKAAGKPELVFYDAENPAKTVLTTDIGATVSEIFAEYTDENKNTPELILSQDDAEIEPLLLALRSNELDYNNTKLTTHFIPLYTVGISANCGNLIPDKKEEERAAYSVMNAIDNGFVSAAALENDDEIAICLASLLEGWIKGEDAYAEIDADLIDGRCISVPYTIYG